MVAPDYGTKSVRAPFSDLRRGFLRLPGGFSRNLLAYELDAMQGQERHPSSVSAEAGDARNFSESVDRQRACVSIWRTGKWDGRRLQQGEHLRSTCISSKIANINLLLYFEDLVLWIFIMT